MHRMASIVQEFNCEPLVIVVSAIGKTTNALEELLQLKRENKTQALQKAFFKIKQDHLSLIQSLELSQESKFSNVLEDSFYHLWEDLQVVDSDPYQTYDRIVSYGEDFSACIVEQFLNEHKLKVKNIDARKLIYTDSRYTRAGIMWPNTERAIRSRLSPVLSSGHLMMTQGFIGADSFGETTTLGREGSDFTAAILAYALNAQEIGIWKDVPGLMNCDPRHFSDAIKLPHVSYNEAIELAFYGASVIHPKTIQPLQKKGIPLMIRSFYEPSSNPSLIDADESDDDRIPKIIVKQKQTLLSISSRNLAFMAEENLQKVFSVFTAHKVHINLMQHSAVSFSVCFDESHHQLEKLIHSLQEDFILKYNTDLKLYTFRHYNQQLVNQFTKGQKLYLSQKNRTTLQLLMR